MNFSSVSVVVVVVLSSVVPLTGQQQEVLDFFCRYQRGNFTANSSFSSNLDRLPSALTSMISSTGFSNVSLGQTPDDQLNSIVLCRGDVNTTACNSCVANAITQLRRNCPDQKEAIIWYDLCMLRYSNRTILGTEERNLLFFMHNNVKNVSDTRLERFNAAVYDLINGLKSRAAVGGPEKKFATGDVSFESFQRIYGLVQCTPDSSEQQCDSCLSEYFSKIPQCCNRSVGGRVIGPSCNFRYEFEALPFYDNTVSSSFPPPPPASLPPHSPENLPDFSGKPIIL